MAVVKSLLVFIPTGFCEIGGGYLVWQWLKEDKPFWYGILGGIILAGYGVVVTFQPTGFGRMYATLAAFSLLWFYCGRGK